MMLANAFILLLRLLVSLAAADPYDPGFYCTVSQIYSDDVAVPRTPSFGPTRFSAAVATTSC